MNGIALGYPWKYRPMEDELVLMTRCQVFKLKVYHSIGCPQSLKEAQQLAELRVREDVAELRRIEQEQRK